MSILFPARIQKNGAFLLPWLLLITIGGMAFGAQGRATFPAFVCASWLATALMGLAWWKMKPTTRQVLLWALVYRLLLLPLLPSLSDDAFRYLWDGWLYLNGVNPFAFRPQDPQLAVFQSLDLFSRLNSPTYYSVYPPVPQYLFALGATFYPLGWKVGYFVIKLLFIGLEFSGVWMLSRLVNARALVLYAWNPLVLMEVAGQPHSEALLACFLIGTVWALQQRRPVIALVFITTAMWTKLYPLLLIPFVLNRTGWRYVWVPVTAGLLLWLPFYHPDFITHVQSSVRLYTEQFEFGAGLYYGLKSWGILLMGHEESKALGPFLQRIFIVAIGFVWLLDTRKRMEFPALIALFLALFFLTATTVHPWYLVGAMTMVPLLADPTFQDAHLQPEISLKQMPIPGWHWIWLGMMMTGNYLFYLNNRQDFWILSGWVGWLLLLILVSFWGGLQRLQFHRAGKKYTWMRTDLPVFQPMNVLDLGAGEGYVGAWFHHDLQANVQLADVVDFNQTALPFTLYDGIHLPFPDDAFEVTTLSFVLHHCQHQEQVLAEAIRVTRGRILILESVYTTAWDLKQLTFLDKLANRLRSRGKMQAQEDHLYFRTVPDWFACFRHYPVRVLRSDTKGLFIHQQAFFSLEVLPPQNHLTT